jgi:hypothetical protein
LKSVNLHWLDIFVHFEVVSLFTIVPVDDALQVISNKLHNNDTPAELSALQSEDITELPVVCMRTTCFQADDKFFQQKDGVAMGSSVTLVTNIYMEQFENLTHDSAQHKPSLCSLSVDNTLDA